MRLQVFVLLSTLNTYENKAKKYYMRLPEGRIIENKKKTEAASAVVAEYFARHLRELAEKERRSLSQFARNT